MSATRQRAWFPTVAGYRREYLSRDVLAGLSAGAVVVPQSMAYATIANLPVQVGLYTCVVPMLVYAAIGGSRAMSVSTTSTIATLTATSLVSAGVVATSTDIPGDLLTLTLLVGVILLVARLLRLGSLVEVINRPTLLGIQVGVGATVLTGQLPKLLGEDSEFTGHGFIRSIVAAVEALPHANVPTIVLSVASITALFLFKRFLPRLPGPLVVVAAGIILAAPGWLEELGVQPIAPVPRTFPTPALPSFDHVGALVPGACAIAVMAFLESAAVARALRDPGDTQIDTNRELLATAAANIAGAFFRTLPSAGGFSQSAVNKGAGARTQAAALVTVGLALLVGLFLGPVLSLLPQATLAALVFVAVFGLIDVKALRELWRVSRRDFAIAAVTAGVGLTAGLLEAVAVGVVFTLLLVLSILDRPRVALTAQHDDVAVVAVLGPLYTANVLGTEQRVLDVADDVPGLRILVLDLTVIQEMSVTIIETLTDLDHELAATGVELRIAGMPRSAAEVAERTPWFQGLVAAGRVSATVEDASPGNGR